MLRRPGQKSVQTRSDNAKEMGSIRFKKPADTYALHPTEVT